MKRTSWRKATARIDDKGRQKKKAKRGSRKDKLAWAEMEYRLRSRRRHGDSINTSSENNIKANCKKPPQSVLYQHFDHDKPHNHTV